MKSLNHFWRADENQIHSEKSLSDEPWPGVLSQPDGAGPFLIEGRNCATGGYPNFNIGMSQCEASQPWNQPFRCQRRANPHGQHFLCVPAYLCLTHQMINTCENGLQSRRQQRAGFR